MKILGLSKEEIRNIVRSGDVIVSVYGLGKMGLPLAVVFGLSGFKVVGIDIDENLLEIIAQGINPYPFEFGLGEALSKCLRRRSISLTSKPARADVHVVLVPTLLNKEKKPDLNPLCEVLKSIATVIEKGDIVIIESTVPPGFSESKAYPMLLESGLKKGEFGLVHAPERTASGRAIQDITESYPKIVGGIDEDSLKAGSALYEIINKKGVIEMSSITSAESVKIFEGLYRDLNIAFANEIALISKDLGIDCIEVIEAANTQPYCHIHMPGAGVGGHCIPVYPYFISHLSHATLTRIARRRNEEMPSILGSLTIETLAKNGIYPHNANVLLLGIAYRAGVKESRFSPFFSIRDYLHNTGCCIYAFDPLYSEEEIQSFGVIPTRGFQNMDAVVVITDHKDFIELDWNREVQVMRHKIIVDGRFCVPLKIRDSGVVLVRIDNF